MKSRVLKEPKFQELQTSLATSDHTVLPATQHNRTHPTLATASKAGTRFTYS